MHPIVFIDESGFSVDSPRDYGYSLRGERVYALKNWQEKGRINAIGALLDSHLLTVELFDGNINSDAFYHWVTEALLPVLPPSSVVVMDNASFHKRADTEAAIIEAGHILEYLPPYSPDLNPIEHKWAECKVNAP
tara:strand:+ start:5404 stop:5808 length:405 start_codon:yes stop_codon:yes gene_type:complete